MATIFLLLRLQIARHQKACVNVSRSARRGSYLRCRQTSAKPPKSQSSADGMKLNYSGKLTHPNANWRAGCQDHMERSTVTEPKHMHQDSQESSALLRGRVEIFWRCVYNRTVE